MRQPASDSDPSPRGPGHSLLRIARLVFDPAVIEDVVRPTIGDLQREVAAAGGDRVRRRRALWHGYRAFWTLVLLAPVGFACWTSRRHLGSAFQEIAERIAFTLIGVTVFASILIAAGRWMMLTLAIGSGLVAFVLHAWWRRHPSQIALPQRGRTPEINLSSIPVGGDIAGLMFVVGSVLTVTAGIPMVRWFLIGVVIGGVGLAMVLTRWRSAHSSGPAALTISTR